MAQHSKSRRLEWQHLLVAPSPPAACHCLPALVSSASLDYSSGQKKTHFGSLALHYWLRPIKSVQWSTHLSCHLPLSLPAPVSSASLNCLSGQKKSHIGFHSWSSLIALGVSTFCVYVHIYVRPTSFTKEHNVKCTEKLE